GQPSVLRQRVRSVHQGGCLPEEAEHVVGGGLLLQETVQRETPCLDGLRLSPAGRPHGHGHSGHLFGRFVPRIIC
ncbi:hypothetical protein NPIL_432191, partial [Nephila pilipes]